MSAFANLPVILVSAKSEAAASQFISELIDNEPPEASGGAAAAAGRVWRIVNKYYSADVRLLPLADGAPPPAAPVEGHVIYLAEDECSVEACERRGGVGAGAAAPVRVVAADAARLPPALRAWAARRRLAPVPLRGASGAGAGADGGEPAGAPAVRAALHAHLWPGLRRHPPAPHTRRDHELEISDEDAEDGELSVERAEQWAAALGAVEGVRALAGAERRAAAEALVGAFCRALGEDKGAL